MSATSTLSAVPSHRKHTLPATSFWRVGEVASYLGTSKQTVRNLIQRGELQVFRTGGVDGWNRVSVKSVMLYCYGSEEEPVDASVETNRTNKIPIALIARVSGNKQSKGKDKGEESDLTRQEERLRVYAEERWGNTAQTTMYSRTSSGMNYEDPIFLSLITDILDGKYQGGFIVAVHPERIVRFGLSMIRTICEKGGAELIFSHDSEQEKDGYESLADDILSVMTHFSAKTYGRRSAETTSRTLPVETTKRAMELRQKGLSVRQVLGILRKEGHKNNKGGNISEYIIYREIDANGKEEALSVLTNGGTTKTEFEKWFHKNVKELPKWDRKNTSDRVCATKLFDYYNEDMKKAGIEVLENRTSFGVKICSLIPKDRIMKSQNMKWFVGYRLAR